MKPKFNNCLTWSSLLLSLCLFALPEPVFAAAKSNRIKTSNPHVFSESQEFAGADTILSSLRAFGNEMLVLNPKGFLYTYPLQFCREIDFWEALNVPPKITTKILKSIRKHKELKLALGDGRIVHYDPKNDPTFNFLITQGKITIQVLPDAPKASLGHLQFDERTYRLDLVGDGPMPIGYVDIKDKATEDSPETYISYVYVEENQRGKGYSRLAMEALARFFDRPEMKTEILTLDVASNNPLAALIYARVGFGFDPEGLEDFSRRIQMPVEELIANFLKDSRLPIPEPENPGHFRLFGRSLEADRTLIFYFYKATRMQRARNAHGFRIASTASAEQILQAYLNNNM